MPHALQLGFFGKLPSHGDFLQRRAPDAFVAVWDRWLQAGIAESRAALGDAWLDIYLTSPAWRFAGAAGACGPAPVCGVMVPSVDRVGRYFPLTIVGTLPAGLDVVSASLQMETFFESVERLVIGTLEAQEVDLDVFDAALRQAAALLSQAAADLALEPSADTVLGDGPAVGVQFGLGTPPRLEAALLDLLARRLAAVYDPVMLWWTEGSSAIDPSALLSPGLPTPEMFTALLDGAWARRGWRSLAAARPDVDLGADPLLDVRVPLTWRSAAASHVGKVRSTNQDAFLERAEAGIWVVADGVGGHADGEIASRMVCDAFSDLGAEPSFDLLVETATERLHQVNGHLVRAALRSENGAPCGSTVVALLVRGDEAAMLWAGDSRIYRSRDGRLTQLTRDHSLADAGEPSSPALSNVITRAVGGDNVLELDVLRDRVRPGDRFLLCSDGLTRTVDEVVMTNWLRHADVGEAVRGLIACSLDAGAPDNVTAVVVDARRATDAGF